MKHWHDYTDEERKQTVDQIAVAIIGLRKVDRYAAAEAYLREPKRECAGCKHIDNERTPFPFCNLLETHVTVDFSCSDWGVKE